MNNTIKNFLLILVFSVIFIPQITFASWWNPVSWSVWNVFRPTPKVQQVQIATTTTATPTATTIKKAEVKTQQSAPKDNKDLLIGSLKKQLADLTQTANQTSQPKVEVPKTSVITFPSGTVVEMDANGNIIRTIKEAPTAVQVPTPRPIVIPNPTPAPIVTPVPVPIVIPPVTPTPTITPTPIIVPPSTPTPPAIVYSDYNFDYKWTNGMLSCPMTPRNIVIKKAVFELPDSELQKINALKDLESDGFNVQIFYPKLYYSAGLYGNYSSTFSLEKRDQKTYVYFGGTISLCSNGDRISIDYHGVLSDITNSGRNIRVYLEGKEIPVEVSDGSGGDLLVIYGSSNSTFSIQMMPVMSEWEVWDNTTGKPVKIK